MHLYSGNEKVVVWGRPNCTRYPCAKFPWCWLTWLSFPVVYSGKLIAPGTDAEEDSQKHKQGLSRYFAGCSEQVTVGILLLWRSVSNFNISTFIYITTISVPSFNNTSSLNCSFFIICIILYLFYNLPRPQKEIRKQQTRYTYIISDERSSHGSWPGPL